MVGMIVIVPMISTIITIIMIINTITILFMIISNNSDYYNF